MAHLKKDRWVFAGAAAVGLLLMFGFIARVIALADAQEEGRKDRADLRSDVGALDDALKRANKRLIKAGESPVTPPVAPPADEPEVNDPDPDDPDPDDPERQDSERQQSERQDGETQERERQDADPDDPDPTNDPDPDDPDPDDPETQDPEIDDPDPNSALTFAVDDRCAPPDGFVVTNVDLTIERQPGTVTFVLTCSAVEQPGPVTTP